MSQKIVKMSKIIVHSSKKIVKMCQKNSSNESKIVDTTLEHIPHMYKVGHLIFFYAHKEIFFDHLNYFVMIV